MFCMGSLQVPSLDQNAEVSDPVWAPSIRKLAATYLTVPITSKGKNLQILIGNSVVERWRNPVVAVELDAQKFIM